MDNVKIAKELVNIAKELIDDDSFKLNNKQKELIVLYLALGNLGYDKPGYDKDEKSIRKFWNELKLYASNVWDLDDEYKRWDKWIDRVNGKNDKFLLQVINKDIPWIKKIGKVIKSSDEIYVHIDGNFKHLKSLKFKKIVDFRGGKFVEHTDKGFILKFKNKNDFWGFLKDVKNSKLEIFPEEMKHYNAI